MPLVGSVPRKEKDTSMSNVVTLGIGMSLCLIGVKVSSSFIVPILGNLGSISMALLYFSNSFANFFVPPILNWFKNERNTMFWASFEYGLYVLNYAYIIPSVNLVWSFVHGIFAAVIWSAEGIYLNANSTDKDRGKKSGIFWTLYMTGAAIGNVAVYFLLKFIGLEDSPNPSGWHGSASVMFIFLGLLSLVGAIPMYLLKPSPKEASRKFIHKVSPGILIKKMVNLVISPNMRGLLIPMFFVGFEYVFIGSMLTRQVHQTGDVGLMMSLFCIIEVIISTPLGVLIDRLGNRTMMTSATLLELAALLSFWYANKMQNGLFYLSFVFLSLSDSIYETIIPTIIGSNYADVESANACFRLFQYMGGCICYLLAPVYVDGTTKWVSDSSLFSELMLCGVLCVFCVVSYILYERTFKREVVSEGIKNENGNGNEIEKDKTKGNAEMDMTKKDIEMINGGNEHLDDISRDVIKKDNEVHVEIEMKEKEKSEFTSNEDYVH